MLRKLLNRLVPTGRPPETDSARAAREAADRLIAEGNRAESAGNPRQACEWYRKAVDAAPGYARAHVNLGIGLEAIGQAEQAIGAYQAALAADGADAFAHYNLGKLFFVRGAPAPAEPHLRAALQHRPEFPEAQMVLASLLEARGDAAGAAAAFEVALRQRPEDFGAWLRYGLVLGKLEREEDAESALKHAASLDPANPDAHAALFELFQSRGDLAAAAVHLEAMLQQRPDWAGALYDYGNVLMRMHRFEESEAAFRRAIALDPIDGLAFRVRGNILLRGGRIRELLELCRAERARAPERFEIESFELFALNFVDYISADEHFAKHKEFGERLEKAFPARFVPLRNDPDPERPLRIGYVSGDFSYHVVSLFMIPLVERHHRSTFEVYCYSVGEVTDAITRQLKAKADVWRDAHTMSEAELADVVHRDGIDILVDLSGHSGIPRLGVFAQRPAPVQATWLGYLNTTGLRRIQYRISDGYCDPPGLTDRRHTETLVRLPYSQWCYRPFVTVDSPGAAAVERNGFVTFGSFTKIAKLTAPMRSLWAQILREVPDSRLVVAGISERRVRDELLQALACHGVQPSRVALLPFMSMQDYYGSFGAVDIAFDTSPYSGGTTTCDALWMGVPVLALPDSRPASRSAASILTTVGLTEWIASSPGDYVRRAVRFAGEKETVAGLRRSLRERMRVSPLMDEERFARDIEDAYRGMWRRWCAGEQA